MHGVLDAAFRNHPELPSNSDIVDLKEMLVKLGPLVQKPRRMIGRRRSLNRRASALEEEIQIQKALSKPASILRNEEDDSSEKLQASFLEYILGIKADEAVQQGLRDETTAVAKRLTSELERQAAVPALKSKDNTPSVLYLRYGNIMYCLLQYVLDSIRSKANANDPTLQTFHFKNMESANVSLTILKFLRKVLTFIMWNAEDHYDNSLSVTNNRLSFRHNSQELERAKTEHVPFRQRLLNKSRMKKARLSKMYRNMSVQGIPQAIEFGVVELIVNLVRNGMPTKVWRKACRLGYELMDNFPADRITLQERLFVVLSDPQNAAFFYGVKAMFNNAKSFIQRRCEKVEAKLTIDEFDDGPIADVCVLLNFVQKLCEGHFHPLQKLLREQPQNQKKINILQLAMDLLHSVLKNFKSAKMGLPMIEKIVTAIMSFFTEAVQGPCKSNQNWLLKSVTLGYCNKILRRLHDETDAQIETYRIRFEESNQKRDCRVQDISASSDDLMDKAKELSQKVTSVIGSSARDITDSVMKGTLHTKVSTGAVQLVKRSLRLLTIDDDDDDEELDEDEHFRFKSGQEVYVNMNKLSI